MMIKLLEAIVKLLESIFETLKGTFKHSHDQQAELPVWMDKHEVMEYLRITKSTYYRWVKLGILTPRNEKGPARFPKEDIVALFEKRKYRERL